MGDTRTEVEKFVWHCECLEDTLNNAREDMTESLFIIFANESKEALEEISRLMIDNFREDVIKERKGTDE